jgi:hypothetical protein
MASKQKSEGLIRWYVSQVLTVVENRDLTDDDVQEAIIDGKDDLGGDFYHRTADGEVLIIQAKFRGTGKSEDAKDITDFSQILERLKDPAWQAKGNNKLRNFLREIDWTSDKFDLRYLALARIEGQAAVARTKAEELRNREGELSVTLRYYPESELNEEHRRWVRYSRGLPSPQTFYIAKGTSVISLEGNVTSSVMVVPGKQLAAVYGQARDALFNLNIRSFLGDTRINKEIKNTIQKSPEEFYYYNNGITCLASKLTVSGNAVEVSSLQVINGAQTIRALDRVYRDKPELLDKVQVLVRITVRGVGYGSEGRFIENIVRYNNSQNPMRPADFISNDPIQKWLHEEFGEHKRLGKEVVYQNKRAEIETKAQEVIPLDDFAKTMYSFLYDPIKFSTGSSFFFTPGKDKGYYKVFGDGERLYDASMPVTEFRLRSAIWWMSKEFASEMKKDKATGKYGAALERKHFVLFASRLILERNFGASYRDLLCKHYRGEWRISDKTAEGRLFRKVYELARQVVVYVFKKDEKDQGDSFNQRNWMRSLKTQESIESFCESGPGIDGLTELV